MSQETVKSLLDKINLLFNVFMKDGLDKISPLEKDLLKEQINKLLKELDNIKFEEPAAAEEVKQAIVETTLIQNEVAPVVVEETPVKEKMEVPSADELLPPVVEAKEPVEINKEVEEKTFIDGKPLRNLKQVIDLNKSFIFKAELFDNNQEYYNNFITDLNALQSERASVAYVENLANQKMWDKEGKVYELLLRSIEKRFLPLLQQ